MKKVFCVLIAALLLLPGLSVADSPDPITGTWYVYSGIVDGSDGVYYDFNTFHFTPDGLVYSSRYDVSADGTTTVQDYHAVGIWRHENGTYFINLAMQGEQETVIENGTMLVPVNESYMIRVRKMEQVDYSQDVKTL